MMKMTKLGWKTLRVDRGARRTSAFATTGALEYPVGRVVRPLKGCGPLTLFEEYNHAAYFARLFSGTHRAVVVPVLYEPYKAPTFPPAGLPYSLWQPKAGPSIRGENLHTYGNTATVDRTLVCTRAEKELPMGTVLASAIKCLE